MRKYLFTYIENNKELSVMISTIDLYRAFTRFWSRYPNALIENVERC